MPAHLYPLLGAPVILIPLAVYAIRQRKVRGAAWYGVLLLTIAVWCVAYAWELRAPTLTGKLLALRVKYIAVVTVPVAWMGFILGFVAHDRVLIRRVVEPMAIAAVVLLGFAWTNSWHGLFWGAMTLEPASETLSVLAGRGPLFWLNVSYTYAALLVGLGVLISQATQSPYLYRKRAIIVVAATVLPWIGNMVFLARSEQGGRIDPTPFLFTCTAILAAVAVFRYGVLDPIPTLHDARIEVIGDGLLILDVQRRVADLNRAAEAIVRRSRATATGAAIEELLPLRPTSGGDARQDLVLRGPGGERVFDARVTPIYSYGARLTGYIVLLRDVTEHRHLEAQLRQAQKMEAVGKLAGGVAHDFNNLLTAIIGFAALALDEVPAGSPAHEWVRQIQRSGEQAAALTRQLLAFGRRQILQPELLDVCDVVRQLEMMLRRLIGEDVTLIAELASGPHRVVADRAQLQQVLVNLAVNGRDAMPRGGVLMITTGRATVADPVREGLDVAPGEYITLQVSDNGEGMDDQTVARIFEPFFTTKPFGKGTGLGLATVYGIVKQSGGDVRVRTRRGEGTQFFVLLPAAAAQGEPAVALDTLPVPRGTGSVLVVEDEASVREFLEEVLRGAGWRVTSAATPAEALALAARPSLEMDLLLTDVVMPGMSGGDLAERLEVLRPGLRVLFVSGYPDEDVTSRGLIAPGRDVLTKPFTPAELRRRVYRLVHPTV
jgi:signal transduction histidine kinase